jgi:hypothetical protein
LKDGEKLFPIGSLPDGRRIYIILFDQLYRLVAQGITWHFPGVFLLLGDCVLDDFEAAWVSWRLGQNPALIPARKAFLDLLRGLFHATISQGWVAHHRSEMVSTLSVFKILLEAQTCYVEGCVADGCWPARMVAVRLGGVSCMHQQEVL